LNLSITWLLVRPFLETEINRSAAGRNLELWSQPLKNGWQKAGRTEECLEGLLNVLREVGSHTKVSSTVLLMSSPW
jgi:hypothetical protein